MRKNSPYLLRSVRDAELTISAPDGTKAKGSSPSNQRASAEPHQEGCRIAGKRANDPRNAGDDREYPPPGGGHSVAILLRRSSALRITDAEKKIGRASCRERVCQYVYISVVAVSLKQKIHTNLSIQ